MQLLGRCLFEILSEQIANYCLNYKDIRMIEITIPKY